ADSSNHRIRKIAPNGVITTIAGIGTNGFSGDGAAGTAAQLSYPSDVAVDGAGNVYIADFGNNRVRKLTPSGVISTVAGTGAAGFAGDGGTALSAKLWGPGAITLDGAGNLLIADRNNNRVRMVDT